MEVTNIKRAGRNLFENLEKEGSSRKLGHNRKILDRFWKIVSRVF
jgi:hypothetical protein